MTIDELKLREQMRRELEDQFGPNSAEKRYIRDRHERQRVQSSVEAQPCELCGTEPAECHHIEYNDQQKIVWLCKGHHNEIHKLPGRRVAPECKADSSSWKGDRKSKLSELQKKLLARGLQSHLRGLGQRDFALRQRGPHNNGVWARAAQRLCQRGLFEKVSHGRWRLTELGVEIARELFPAITLETERPTEAAPLKAVERLRGQPRPPVRRSGPRLSKAEADAQFKAALGLR